MAEHLVVASRIKQVIGNELNVSGELADALNKEVRDLLTRAAERAKANNRKTVMAKDL